MRECGECTLCCKIPRIDPVEKSSNVWCRHCVPGVGCSIYNERPRVCKDFECWWLSHPEMPEELRPDKIGMYVSGSQDKDVLSVRVDPDYTGSLRDSLVVNYFRDHHLLVAKGDQLTFVCALGRTRPDKLMVEWTL